MLPLLSPHPPPTQSTRKVLYAPTTVPLSNHVCMCVRVFMCGGLDIPLIVGT